MNADRLLEHYERIADAPDAIPRLRQFILDLAVRGKLVPQDPNDEVAVPVSISSQASGAIPKGWGRARLAELLSEDTRNGYARRPDDEPHGAPILRISAGTVRADGVVAEEQHKLIKGISPQLRSQYGLDRGDLLACRFNGNKRFVGRLSIFTDYLGLQPIYPDKLIRVRPNARLVLPEFLRLAGDADTVRADIEAHCATTVGNWGISASNLKEVKFPVPPLAEQRRIVAKVDGLMALCDGLEAARAGREAARDRLAAAALARLNRPDPDKRTFATHTRFALDNLSSLTARTDQVKQLRQAILNLAVRGKLVPEHPADEPASELVKRIGEEKARSKGGGDYRKQRMAAPVAAGTPWSIPPSWIWALLGDLVISRDGERIPVSKEERSQRAKVFDYYGASGVIDRIDGYLFDKPLLLIGEDGANLINRSTPIAFMARGKYWVNNHAHVVDGLSEDLLRYLELFINATDLRPYLTGTAQPKMNQAKLNSIPVALPPLAQQRRIVARVDELMALCDQLEASLTASDDTRRRLLDALLAAALQTPKAGRVDRKSVAVTAP